MESILNLSILSGLESKPAHGDSDRVFPSNVHICHFFNDEQDLLELLVPYFVEGLRQNEFCLWGVAQPLTIEKAQAALNEALDGELARFVKAGQLEIFDVSQLYGSGVFDAMAVKDAFLKKVFSSLQGGWKAFRCDGMASALAPSNWRNYQTYESEITRSLTVDITALCSYDLRNLSSKDVIEVVSTHQASLLKKHNRWHVVESIEYTMNKEAQRKESEFRQLADSMPQLAWMANAYGHMHWYNQRWYEYTGTTFETMRTEAGQAVYREEDLALMQREWKISIETGRPLEVPVSLRSHDGRYSPFLLRAMPLRDQTGKVTRWFGTATDLSSVSEIIVPAKEA